MANGINAIANLLGTVNANGALLVALDGGTATASGLKLPNTGASATTGRATLVGGTVTVSTTAATATANIFLQRMTAGGTIGFATTITRSNGISFTITADNVLDTSTYMWFIVDVY